jgi:hypothetical protein
MTFTDTETLRFALSNALDRLCRLEADLALERARAQAFRHLASRALGFIREGAIRDNLLADLESL